MNDLVSLLAHPTGSVWRWFARNADIIRGGFCESAYGLERIRLNHLDWNLYIGLNPTRQRLHLKVSDKDITHFQFMLIDIDPVEPDARPFEAAEEAIELGSSILGARIDPHLLDSGRGCQLWLQCERSDLDSEETRILWQRRIHGFLYRLGREFGLRRGCRVDTSCSDLSRLARFPGSINSKTSRFTRLVRAGSSHASLEWPEYHRPHSRNEQHASTGNHSLRNIYDRLTARARIFLTEGVEEPGRHAACYATAASLRDVECDYKRAEQFVLYGAALCRPSLDDGAARRACRNAYRGTRWDANHR